MATTKATLDIPAPRPWLWYENHDGQLMIADANGNEVAQVFVEDEVAQRICTAINGASDTIAPLPFGMVEARDEANRRYQETRQEFWAGLADLLADAVAVEEYRRADRLEADRLRMELAAQSEVLTETGRQKLDALFEAAKLRDLVRRLVEFMRPLAKDEHGFGDLLMNEATDALAKEAQA